MFDTFAIVLLSIAYLVVFVARNLIVKARTGQKIRSRDRLLTTSIISTAVSIGVTILSTMSVSFYRLMIPFMLIRYPLIAYAGFLLFGISILMGWMISAQLRNSWRVGVHADQKTELIQDGIYARIRNPYFLSYFLMFLSLFLVRLSLILLGLLVFTVAMFHRMVLKEERFLTRLHGQAYLSYKQATGRYFPKQR